jgi:hypothetical protein
MRASELKTNFPLSTDGLPSVRPELREQLPLPLPIFAGGESVSDSGFDLAEFSDQVPSTQEVAG